MVRSVKHVVFHSLQKINFSITSSKVAMQLIKIENNFVQFIVFYYFDLNYLLSMKNLLNLA